jgi:hypothetical protein
MMSRLTRYWWLFVSVLFLYSALSLLMIGSVLTNFNVSHPFHIIEPTALFFLIILTAGLGITSLIFGVEPVANGDTWG